MKSFTDKKYNIIFYTTIIIFVIFITGLVYTGYKSVIELVKKEVRYNSINPYLCYLDKKEFNLKEVYKNFDGEEISIDKPQILQLGCGNIASDIPNLIFVDGIGQIHVPIVDISLLDEEQNIIFQFSIPNSYISNYRGYTDFDYFCIFLRMMKEKFIEYFKLDVIETLKYTPVCKFISGIKEEVPLEVVNKILTAGKVYARLDNVPNSQISLLYNSDINNSWKFYGYETEEKLNDPEYLARIATKAGFDFIIFNKEKIEQMKKTKK